MPLLLQIRLGLLPLPLPLGRPPPSERSLRDLSLRDPASGFSTTKSFAHHSASRLTRDDSEHAKTQPAPPPPPQPKSSQRSSCPPPSASPLPPASTSSIPTFSHALALRPTSLHRQGRSRHGRRRLRLPTILILHPPTPPLTTPSRLLQLTKGASSTPPLGPTPHSVRT